MKFLQKRNDVHYREQWELLEMSTVGEEKRSGVAGKWWPFSALKRITNKYCETCTVVGHSRVSRS